MSGVITVYDEKQHCTAKKMPQEKKVFMDCPYTGKGEEFSPTNLVEAALAGCMLLSMGTLAIRNEIDITGAEVEVNIVGSEKPPHGFASIEIVFKMPKNYTDIEKKKLERASAACPIKHSFRPDVAISVKYNYPE
ncbi:OsmC family protein [Candidatus Riflebacteria bacterium]